LKYRKKPVVIEAMQLTANNENEVIVWAEKITCEYDEDSLVYVGSDGVLVVETPSGELPVNLEDWIILGPRRKGVGVLSDFYPCKPDVFEATYEKV